MTRRLCCAERLIEVRDDVIDVFDPNAEPNHLRCHPGPGLFFGRHLPMGSRGWVTCQRLSVTQIDETLDEFKRVVEGPGGLKPSLDPKSHQRAGLAGEIFLGERIIRAVRESGVVDPLNSAILAQELGYASAILPVPLDPQRNRLDSL